MIGNEIPIMILSGAAALVASVAAFVALRELRASRIAPSTEVAAVFEIRGLGLAVARKLLEEHEEIVRIERLEEVSAETVAK